MTKNIEIQYFVEAISLFGMTQVNFAQDIHVTTNNKFDCKMNMFM